MKNQPKNLRPLEESPDFQVAIREGVTDCIKQGFAPLEQMEAFKDVVDFKNQDPEELTEVINIGFSKSLLGGDISSMDKVREKLGLEEGVIKNAEEKMKAALILLTKLHTGCDYDEAAAEANMIFQEIDLNKLAEELGYRREDKHSDPVSLAEALAFQYEHSGALSFIIELDEFISDRFAIAESLNDSYKYAIRHGGHEAAETLGQLIQKRGMNIEEGTREDLEEGLNLAIEKSNKEAVKWYCQKLGIDYPPTDMSKSMQFEILVESLSKGEVDKAREVMDGLVNTEATEKRENLRQHYLRIFSQRKRYLKALASGVIDNTYVHGYPEGSKELLQEFASGATLGRIMRRAIKRILGLNAQQDDYMAIIEIWRELEQQMNKEE